MKFINQIKKVIERKQEKRKISEEPIDTLEVKIDDNEVLMVKLEKGDYSVFERGTGKKIKLNYDLWVDLFKVSCEQICQFIKREGLKDRDANEWLWTRNVDPWDLGKPIEVTFAEAKEFAERRNKRLPTIEEWELFAYFLIKKKKEIVEKVKKILTKEGGFLLPLDIPAEWVDNGMAKGNIGKGVPEILKTFNFNNEERVFSFRCCKEE